MENIGNRIADIRKQKALSQEELADRASINIRTLQRIEKGETEPRGHTLNALCQVLDLRPEDILDYGKEEDRQFRIILHLSVLAFLVIPLGNLLLPLILWLTKGKKVLQAHEQGANILNFQLVWTVVTYALVGTGAFFKLESLPNAGWFLVGFGVAYVVNFILPLVAAWKAQKGEAVHFYPELVKIVR